MSTTLPDAPVARPAPKPVGRSPIALILRPLASLQLTVALMGFAVGLVFFGTLAQKGAGMWTVVTQYFWSWVVLVDVNHLLEFGRIFFGLPANLHAQSWAVIPWPGGKLLGGLMFVNLLVAQLTRLRLSWKRSGVYLLHAGLILLFVGEFIAREFQQEQQIRIVEGQSAAVAFDTRGFELAFTDRTDPAHDRVAAVSAVALRRVAGTGRRISHPDLPVDVEVLSYFTNSGLADVSADNPATTGVGSRLAVTEKPEVSGVDQGEESDTPSAYVRLHPKGGGQPLGTYLATAWTDPLLLARPLPGDEITADGRPYTVGLQLARRPKPYTLTLNKFTYEKYSGTEKAKNYASTVRLSDPAEGVDLTATIAMNSPLRHGGETFYQHQYSVTPAGQQTTLQVVRNPGWRLPYFACLVVSAGMVLHFTIALTGFLRRSVGPKPVAAVGEPWSPRRLLLPAATLFLTAVLVAGAARPVAPQSGKLDLSAAARLPVLDGGRVKPLDTVARVDLRVITHREEFTDSTGGKGPAVRWFLDVASGGSSGGVATRYPIFRVENDQVLALLQLKPRDGLRYSIDEMKGRFAELEDAGKQAARKDAKQRDAFAAGVLEVGRHVETYLKVWQGKEPTLLPPVAPRTEWRSPEQARREAFGRVREKMTAAGLPANPAMLNRDQQIQAAQLIQDVMADADADPAMVAWDGVLDAYRTNDPARFDAAGAAFAELGRPSVTSGDSSRVRLETALNQTALYYHCIWLYVLAWLAVMAGWLSVLVAPGFAEPLRRIGVWMLVGTLVVHTVTLLARMYLMDRPLVFVTNLYSTAVFIGWGAVIIGLVVERVLPLGVGASMAATVGYATTVLAHNLATSGDTLEMMQAVLDTNFWLATHVTTINLGYSASYLAGAVGLAYVVLGLLPRDMGLGKMVTVGAGSRAKRMELGKAVGQALYGVVCLATLLSFVGTVLGGIWGDQSWGRFWGWDPKENGALLIVLWNALILHARWCGLVKERGMALLALAGNMIVTWSYFGTNQLQVGLHAYGFSKELVNVCWGMWVFHAAVIVVGLIPWHRLRGEATTPVNTR